MNAPHGVQLFRPPRHASLHLQILASSLPRRGLVFIGPKGGKTRRSNFNVIWSAACAAAGIPDAHFHDLRHGWHARRDYRLATRDRDKVIAQALGVLADKARNGP